MSTQAQVRIVPYNPSTVSSKEIESAFPGDSLSKVGTARVLWGPPTITAVSTLGDKFDNKKGDERREIIRKTVGSAVKAVKVNLEGLNTKENIKEVIQVEVDDALDPHAAAVAAHLAAFEFNLKTNPVPSRFNPNLKQPIPEKFQFRPIKPSREWERGVTYAYSQNLARTLADLPANMMTPTIFCERVKKEFEGVANVEIIVRDEKWAELKGMNTFLSVTHGTSEPAKLLEIHYKGAESKDEKPVAFVGKGITFDSGGISLKPGEGMKLMRGDMGGAAAVVSAALAIAKLKLPVNLVTVTPLTENMPGPAATKPGDIVYAMNGKTVEVDNTDAEGRLVLSDAIYYTGTEYKPHTLIDVATLTGAMMIAVGEHYSGVFSSSDELWQNLQEAGAHEYDRFWRMPLDEDYGPQIYSSNADLCNTGGRPAGSCTAALFLKNFVPGLETDEPTIKWAHIDIAGAMGVTKPRAYMEKGMSGAPVRGLIEYVRRLSGTA
ncbi:hypothetical protein E1B28_001930 [Marasmius oreades]|uniref:leucyl aminopeptidase n=1 Tax=Marasmius oreades TaxID=181124 RepID=A0A9P8AFP7_9AGAR|nr:uncharacterized protein E1B28_001930 [Marasmius oreades]KAG7100151.1 hypothetical protein E1B28_001930 [Marasmius oreades]